MLTLICDDRESSVIPFIQMPFLRQRLTVGDYAIMHGDTLVAIIERKTWADYAASFKDGRHENRKKMMELRETHKCVVYYIVEGTPWPDPASLCGGIPYKHILSSMDHLQYRDNIHVIQTKNQHHTAQRLSSLVTNLSTLEYVGGAPIQNDLTAVREKTPDEICRKMWAAFAGITVNSADQFAARYTLREVVCQQTPVDFGTKRQRQSLANIDKETEIRLLSRVPGVSVGRAKSLLAAYSLRQLLEAPPEVVATIETNYSKRNKVGQHLAIVITTCFDYKINPPPLTL